MDTKKAKKKVYKNADDVPMKNEDTNKDTKKKKNKIEKKLPRAPAVLKMTPLGINAYPPAKRKILEAIKKTNTVPGFQKKIVYVPVKTNLMSFYDNTGVKNE